MPVDVPGPAQQPFRRLSVADDDEDVHGSPVTPGPGRPPASGAEAAALGGALPGAGAVPDTAVALVGGHRLQCLADQLADLLRLHQETVVAVERVDHLKRRRSR